MEQFGQLLSNWESGAAFAGSVRPQLERLFPAERSHLLLRLLPLVPDKRPPGLRRFPSLGQTRTLAAVRSTNSPQWVTCTGSDHCSHPPASVLLPAQD
uniref:TOMM20-like protein 1 n=1 Tax=Macrostomum lignano TaxID=282301 RepID=A0A1I8FJX2_9PLAT